MEVKDPVAFKRRRLNLGYTQRDLAYLVRRTQTTIYKIETGQLRNITEGLALALAARLDRDWEDLFVAHEESVMPQLSTVPGDRGNSSEPMRRSVPGKRRLADAR